MITPFRTPLYPFVLALIIGLILTKAPKFNHGITNPIYKKLSAFFFLFPLTLCFFIGLQLKKHGFEYKEKSSYKYHSMASLEELVNNLKYHPRCWHNWYFIHRKLKKNNETRSIANFALHQAAINNPNRGQFGRIWLGDISVHLNLKNLKSPIDVMFYF